MRYLLLAALIFCSFQTFSQNYFHLLEKGKYEKAWKDCQKKLSKESSDIEALYFATLISFTPAADNLFLPFKGHGFFVRLNDNYSQLRDVKTLERLADIPITSLAIKKLQDSMFNNGLIYAKSLNTEAVFIEYLALFTNAPDGLRKQAEEGRNHAAYVYASSLNTLEGFQAFLDKYPYAIDAALAKKERNKLAYAKANQLHTIEGYKRFINSYPEAEQVPDAWSNVYAMAFSEAKSNNTIPVYERFISDYPKAPQVQEAKENIHVIAFEVAQAKNNAQAFKYFLEKYPNSKQESLARAQFYLLEFKENTRTSVWESYRDFYEQFNGPYKQIAKDSLLRLASLNTNSDKALLYCIDHGIGDKATLIRQYYSQISKDGELSTLNFFSQRFEDDLSAIEAFEDDYSKALLASDLGLTAEAQVQGANTEMEKRLKREGAKTGAISVSLMWDNYNDIDLHCVDPNGEEIYYSHRYSRSGGELDVDMNAGGPDSDEPVENIYWEKRKAKMGKYKVYVNHFMNHLCNECADPTNFSVVIKQNNIVKEFNGSIYHGEPKRLIYSFDFLNKRYGELELNSTTISKLENYIKTAPEKELAFVAMQKYVTRELSQKKWSDATAMMNRFGTYFQGNKKFQDLKSLLSEKAYGIKINEVSSLNSPLGEEYSPVISGDGKELFFCGFNRADSLGGEDVYSSKMINGIWQQPEVVTGLSHENSNDALLSVSTDGTKALMFHNGKLAISEKTTYGWSNLSYLPAEINNCSWAGDAMFSSDGNALIFASVRENDGHGISPGHNEFYHATQAYFSDIYVCTKTDKSWSKPMNIGSVINTKYIERSPFLHPDMKTLYFSSDGRGGMGRMDVFMTTRLSDTCWNCWSEPINLGKEINTVGDDWGYRISTDGTTAFFSKKGATSQTDDLFQFTLPTHLRPDVVARIEGEVKNSNNEPISTTIRWEDLENNRLIGTAKTDPKDGSYFIVLPMGKNYGYYIEDSTHFPISKNLDLRNVDSALEVQKNMVAFTVTEMIEKGIAVPINNLFFEFGKSTLLPSSYPELIRVSKLIREEDFVIELRGHTDDVGSLESNQRLSEERARNVAKFLMLRGVTADKIKVVGYGKTQPLANNSTEEGRALNRRVEIRFVR